MGLDMPIAGFKYAVTISKEFRDVSKGFDLPDHTGLTLFIQEHLLPKISRL
jgi:hypothetical protein